MVLRKSYMTISEVAKEFGVTRQTVSRWLRDGKIEAEQVGREKLVSKKSLEKFLQTQIEELGKRIKKMKAAA